MYHHASIDTALRARTDVDAILGAVSTWDLGRNHTELYFKHSELVKLYADTTYPYASEGEFMSALQKRFAGSQIVDRASSDRLIVRLAPETVQETMIQLTAVRAVAGARSEIPTRY